MISRAILHYQSTADLARRSLSGRGGVYWNHGKPVKKKCKVGGVYQAGAESYWNHGKPVKKKCKVGRVYQAGAELTGTMGNQ